MLIRECQMTLDKLRHDWKNVSTLYFLGIALAIPMTVLMFDIITGYMFRGFTAKSPGMEALILRNILHVCLGSCIAANLYKLRRAYSITAAAAAVTVMIQMMIFFAMRAGLSFDLLALIAAERIALFASLVLAVVLFRHFEQRLDFAEVSGQAEFEDKDTKIKYTTGKCGNCGSQTVTSRERQPGKGRKNEFFCDNCKIYIRGNPLPGAVVSLMFMLISAAVLYGTNEGLDETVLSAFNLLWVMMIFIGARSFYFGIKWTLYSLGGGNSELN
jgi:hypothetical protein